jgi:hypothetical protein
MSLVDVRAAEPLSRALELSLTEAVRPQDVPQYLGRSLMNRDGGTLAWSFIRQHWEEVTARLAPSTVIYVAYGARSLTAPPVVEDVQAFFAEHGIPQSAQQLRQILEAQRVNAAFRRCAYRVTRASSARSSQTTEAGSVLAAADQGDDALVGPARRRHTGWQRAPPRHPARRRSGTRTTAGAGPPRSRRRAPDATRSTNRRAIVNPIRPTCIAPSASAASPPTSTSTGSPAWNAACRVRTGLRFDADDPDVAREPGRDAADQPAATDRDEHRLDQGTWFELRSDRALARDDGLLVVGVHQDRPE